ncbi:sec1 family domain-containing protein 1-like isoform X2 [Hylaeus volcanicus]|nr:sec1 family domain-containing protein 1-like isoform X2 [Hylaeus volcanicus]
MEIQRSCVPNAPAIYFIEPTQKNIDGIVQDIQNHFYKEYYINFSSTASSELLEYFASTLPATAPVDSIVSIVDRFVQFISLSEFEFVLDIPKTFSTLHSTGSTDALIEECLKNICTGLVSVIITLGVIPVIRYPSSPTSPCRMLGQMLNTQLKQYISCKKTNQLFCGTKNALMERPLLVLLDREFDLNVMLHHTWTYQSIVHDLFDLRLNRVTLHITEGVSEKTTKTFDVDSTDTLWKEYGCKPFGETAIAISNTFQDYSTRKSLLDQNASSKRFDEPNSLSHMSGIQSTLDTLNAVPEMVAQKKSIDMHTNIAHAIVAQITLRKLDRFYEVEDSIETGSIASALASIEKLVDPAGKGTIADKKRVLLCFYIARKNELSNTHLTKLKTLLFNLDAKCQAFKFLECLESLKALEIPDVCTLTQQKNVQPASTTNWGANLLDRSKGLFQEVKNLLPTNKTYPIERIMLELLQNKSGSMLDKEFIYTDPKMEQYLNSDTALVPRIKSSFKQAILFTVGGGSYVESQTLKEIAKRTGKQILYGTTEFVTPEAFLEELEVLGSHIS